jgi:hypothetical protein
MASRLALGRIIEWAKNADVEELKYVVHRVANIAQARLAQVEQADAHNAKKPRRARKPKINIDANPVAETVQALPAHD